MATVTLDVTIADLRNELTRFFTAGRTYSASTATGKDVDAAISRGLRKFYTPPILPGDRVAHIWSFLYPAATIRVFGDLTGTATTSPWNTTALKDTAADDVNNIGFFVGTRGDGLDLIGQLISIKDVSAGTTFTTDDATPPIQTTVSGVTDKENIVSTKTFSNTPSSSTTDTYIITVDGNYILPKDFGGIVGPTISFEATTGFAPIEITSESRINRLRQDNRVTQTFRPRLAAVRPISVSGALATPGQQWELMLWPIPDNVYTLHYRYLVAVESIVESPDVTTNRPPGGMFHGETIMASCLAIAETMLEPAPSVRRREEAFMERLAASVSLDRQLTTPDTLGIAGDATGLPLVTAARLQTLSYNGISYGPGA